jgi:drug/metabolite transporter (DMT)-like permease
MVLFKRSGDEIPPLALNYFKNTIGLVLFVLSLLVSPTAFPETSFHEDILLLVSSGAIGIGLADTLLFRSLNILGASRSAIVACTYSPLIMFFSYVILGEELTVLTAVGATLVISGLFLIARQGAAADLTRRELLEGVVFGLISIALMGIAIVAIKPVLELYAVLWATTLRMLGGLAVLTVFVLASRQTRRQVAAAFVPKAIWRFALPGSIVGTYLALLFWIAGFKYTEAITASILNQMSTLLVVLLAALFLRERLTGRKLLAVLLGSIGSILTMQ